MFQQTIVIDTSVAVFEQGRDNPGVAIKNTGSTVVHVTDTPGIGSAGFDLSPGAYVRWAPGIALWVWGPGTVFVSEGLVMSSDPAAAASAISAEGLTPAGIATSLFDSGIPAVRRTATSTLTVGDGIASTWTSDILDVAGYDRALMVIEIVGDSSNAMYYFDAQMMVGGTIVQYPRGYTFVNGVTQIVLPLHTDQMRLTMRHSITGAPVNARIHMTLSTSSFPVGEEFVTVPKAEFPTGANVVKESGGSYSLGYMAMRLFGNPTAPRTVDWHIPANGKPFRIIASAGENNKIVMSLNTYVDGSSAPEASEFFTLTTGRVVYNFVPPRNAGVYLRITEQVTPYEAVFRVVFG